MVKMSVDIIIPNLGESITQVTIGALLKPSGTIVRRDEELVELETDKLNQPLYAPADGLLQFNVKTGDSVPVGHVIGVIVEVDRAIATPPSITTPPPVISPPKREVKEELSDNKILGLVLDAERYIEKPLPSLRKAIGKRLLEAQEKSVMLTTFNEIDMSKVIALREEFKEEFFKQHGVKLGYMSFFVKAATLALKLFPNVNSFIEGDRWVFNKFYDIAVAVASEKGLVVPVVRTTNHLSFAEIEKAIIGFVDKANRGVLTAEEMTGASFTITNGGVFGSLLSTPILNSPQAAILGMHAIQKRAVVIDDQIVVRPMMYVALTYDHKVLDGKESVLFLKAIKEHIEEPERLLFEI